MARLRVDFLPPLYQTTASYVHPTVPSPPSIPWAPHSLAPPPLIQRERSRGSSLTLGASGTAFCAPVMAQSPRSIPWAQHRPKRLASTRRGLSSETSLLPMALCTASCAPRTAPSPCLMPLVHNLP